MSNRANPQQHFKAFFALLGGALLTLTPCPVLSANAQELAQVDTPLWTLQSNLPSLFTTAGADSQTNNSTDNPSTTSVEKQASKTPGELSKAATSATLSLTTTCAANCVAPASVLLSAVTAPAGAVGKVEFYRDGVLINTKTAPWWLFTDTAVTAGDHVYTVKAYDTSTPPQLITTTTKNVTVAAPVLLGATLSASCAAPCNAPASVTLTATTTVPAGKTITKVEFYQGSTLLATVVTPPYTLNLSNVAGGAYSYSAKVFDSTTPTALTATSVAQTVSVNTAPAVTLVASCAANPCVAPASVNLSASASDTDGSITKVEFYRGASLIATKTAAPWTYTDTTLAVGSYSYTAKAFDNGTTPLSATSSAQNISVLTAGVLSSVLTTTCAAPCNAPASVTFTVTATAPTGKSITKVEFFDGATLVGTVTSAPYTFTLNNLSGGNHSFTAKVTDNTTPTANTVTSSAQTLAINTAPTVTLTAVCASTPCAAPATVNLTASPVDSDGTITKVEFYRGATLIATKTAAPWTYLDTALAVGNYSYTAKAFDNGATPLSTTSAAAAMTVNAPAPSSQIIVEAGVEGLTTSDKQLSFQGYLVGFPANSAVFINEILVPLSLDGKFFINDLALQNGSNTITIKANTLTASLSKTFTVVSTVNTSFPTTLAPHFELSALPDKGDAPHASQLIIKRLSSAAFDSITVDYTRDGIVDRVVLPAEFSNNIVSLPLSYPTPGLYTLKVTAWQDAAKSIKLHETERIIFVSDPLDDITHKKQVYQWMVDQLIANNPSQALNAFIVSSVSKYKDTFDFLGSNLPTAASKLGTVESVKVGAGTTELIVVRTTNGKRMAYRVYLLQEHDGLWRIEDM